MAHGSARALTRDDIDRAVSTLRHVWDEIGDAMDRLSKIRRVGYLQKAEVNRISTVEYNLENAQALLGGIQKLVAYK